jgi:hypothetical protein
MSDTEFTRIEAEIADELALHMPEGDGGQDGAKNLAIARSIVAALKAGRIAVVELPEPVLSPRHQERIWEVGDSHVVFNEKWLNIHAELDYDGGDDDPLSPSDATAFAAALLAAVAEVSA